MSMKIDTRSGLQLFIVGCLLFDSKHLFYGKLNLLVNTSSQWLSESSGFGSTFLWFSGKRLFALQMDTNISTFPETLFTFKPNWMSNYYSQRLSCSKQEKPTINRFFFFLVLHSLWSVFNQLAIIASKGTLGSSFDFSLTVKDCKKYYSRNLTCHSTINHGSLLQHLQDRNILNHTGLESFL